MDNIRTLGPNLKFFLPFFMYFNNSHSTKSKSSIFTHNHSLILPTSSYISNAPLEKEKNH
jgi:hypothetical protein